MPDDLLIAAVAVVVLGGCALWGARVARASRDDQARGVDALYTHFAELAARTGLTIDPPRGAVMPGLWGERGGFMIRMTTALIDDLQCSIAVEAPPSLRWRPHRALHRGTPPALTPAAQTALERLRRRVRSLDVEAGALHCTLVSTELRVPALPEILADLVAVADGLPRT